MFGELALLYNVPRAATITAKEKCVLWSLDRETFNNLIPNQELLAAMMRRVWLDNSLSVACQDVFRLLEEIMSDPETNQKSLTTLCKEPSYQQTLKQEWDKKELTLKHLADLLESTRMQIRLEGLIISGEDLSAPKDGQG